MEAKTRLAAARERAGFRSARQAAATHDWAYASYASHEQGKRNIPPKAAQRYAAAFRVSPEFILFGKNPPPWADTSGGFALGIGGPRIQTRALPLFSTEDADALRRWTHDDSQHAETYVISNPGYLSGRAFALRVSSDEMRAKPPVMGERDILPGDVVVIDRQSNCKPGDIVAVMLDESPRIHLRKVVARDVNQLAYVPLNHDYAEFEDGNVLGRVSLHIQWL